MEKLCAKMDELENISDAHKECPLPLEDSCN